MEADIEQNTRQEFKRFLVTLLQCEREEGIDAIDDDQAAEDAQELYDVCLQIIWTDLIEFLGRRSSLVFHE